MAVMQNGEVAELSSPRDLMGREGGKGRESLL